MKKIVHTFYLVSLFFAVGCAHNLEVKNLDSFITPATLDVTDKKTNLGILPFNGDTKFIWYFNTILEGLKSRKEIDKIQSNYGAKENIKPDYVLYIEPNVEYKSSGANFFISFPGFLIFTPAWNGYVYYADINTKIIIYNNEEEEIKSFNVNIPYSVRQAEFDRTFWDTGLGWLGPGWGVFAILGGIYNSTVFDKDIINEFQYKVSQNYKDYVVEQILKELRSS